jgi:hypothetical protein
MSMVYMCYEGTIVSEDNHFNFELH